MEYNRAEILSLIASTPKGAERAKLLENEEFRNLVLNSGANVTIYTGDVKPDAETVTQMLSDVYIGLIQRKNRRGNFDGLGALGGLAERTNVADFESLSTEEKIKLASVKDDVIIADGKPLLITDIDVIRKNNVLREMREELANLGIQDISLNPQNLELISMPKVKDDNYMINIWDGNGECYAVNPYCHVYKDTLGIIDSIVQNASEQIGGEASGYKKIPIIEALTAYGNMDSEQTLENGRSATKDYRYPHEYLACWALASKLLNGDDEKMVQLAMIVQRKCEHPISFAKIADDTSQRMEDIADVLKIKPETLERMEKCAKNIYNTRSATQNFNRSRNY